MGNFCGNADGIEAWQSINIVVAGWVTHQHGNRVGWFTVGNEFGNKFDCNVIA
jgi:hypothetical protein